ncbi:DUF4184 family protein [Micromonospora echinaurantiaca]|uniref:DUF4184 family protein n=1 Tax=Micromonospora echinaurantiaca TaxID=47857 RepID=UPI0037A18371
MPLTFPSHLAAVLPLKLWRPRWFDGVALAAGAVSPDVAYLAAGTRFEVGGTHTAAGLFWWCLPVALGYAWLARRCAAVVAPWLPGRATTGWVADARTSVPRWWITGGSALLGAVTHLGWDHLTHTDGWLRALGVDWYARTGLHWWTVADLSSTLLGAAVAVDLARRLARRHGMVNGRPAPGGPAVFGGAAVATALGGVALLPALPAAGQPAATGVRLLHVLALALLVGGLAARRAWRPRRGRSDRK